MTIILELLPMKYMKPVFFILIKIKKRPGIESGEE